MNQISAWAIRNPVPTIVLFLFLSLSGVVSFSKLRINDMPDFDIPTVTVSVSRPGAAPTEMETQVTRLVEDSVSGLGNVKHILSTVNEGVSTTSIEFALGTNIDRAVEDVRNAVEGIRPSLPSDVPTPLVQRVDATGQPILTFVVDAPGKAPDGLSWFIDNDVAKAVLSVAGVSRIERSGGVNQEIRVRLDPDRLMALGITASEVSEQLKTQNVDQPGGRMTLGDGEQAIRTVGSATDVEMLARTRLILKGGRTVMLSELGVIERSWAEPRQRARLNDREVIGFSVYRSVGTGEVNVTKAVRAKVAAFAAEHPDVTIREVTTSSDGVLEGYAAAIEAVLIGAVLAVIVVWLFLRDVRATLISSAALPLSLLPTFGVMYLLDESLNTTTLLGIALVVGLLVDDAIVEIENIVRHMRQSGKNAYDAAMEAADEIGLAVVATTFAIIAVFVPVGFMPGIAGQLFKAFAIAVCASAFFSLVVARMLTPLMGAYLLKPHGTQDDEAFWIPAYLRFLKWTLRWRWITVIAGVAFFAGSMSLTSLMPMDFIPASDKGRSVLAIELAPGASLADTDAATRRAIEFLKARSEVMSVYAALGTRTSSDGIGAESTSGEVRKATLTVNLKPRGERALSQQQFEASVAPQLAEVPGARVRFGADGRSGAKVQVALRSENADVLSRTVSAVTREMQATDIPAVEREVQLFAGQLNDYARRLGLPDVAAMERARPSDAALALARALIAEGAKLQTSLSTNSVELAEEQEKLEQLANEVELQGPAVDPKPFADRLAALAPQLRQLDRHVELAENFAKVRRQLEEGASRLKPALPAPIDAIATSELPSVETLARIHKTLDGIDRDRDRLADRLSEIEASIRKHEQHLTAFVSERPVPTREAITAQRGRRDAIWQGLRSTLLGEADPLTPAAVPQSVREFERHIADADGLSDDALVDASRVAEFAATERHLAQARYSHVELQGTLATLDRDRQAEWTAYETEWSRSGISRPLPPAEMVVWLDGVGKLLEKREEARDAKAKLDAINAAMDAVAPEIIRLAGVVGLDELSGLEPPVLALRIEVRLREMTEAWNQRRDLETSVRAARDRVAKLLRQQKSLEEKRENWQTRWQPAMTAISAGGATLEQAQAALDVWQAVPATASAHDDRAGRVVAMRTEMAAFATKIAGVVKAVAPDLEGLAPEIALRQLNNRLSEATKASTRHAEAERHLAEAVRKKEKAELDLANAEASLGQLVKRLPGDVDLLELCQNLKSRDSLVQSLAKLRSQLLTQADGLPEEELRSQLADFDPDLAIGVLKNLDIENEHLDRSANETFAEHKTATTERTSLEQGGGAELAALQKRSAEAELIASTQEWSVLKLGAMLLGATIDQQRSSQQDPLMRRAGELLATITGGAFSGLGQEFDDKDRLRLVGQRPGGEVVHVEGMSEGARDQLYLALRLAYLEDYAKRSEPIPFIGDDVFMTFDDARAMNGLIALASLSQNMQPILFTHHKHVVDLAQEALGHDVDVMEIASTARFLRQPDTGA